MLYLILHSFGQLPSLPGEREVFLRFLEQKLIYDFLIYNIIDSFYLPISMYHLEHTVLALPATCQSQGAFHFLSLSLTFHLL